MEVPGKGYARVRYAHGTLKAFEGREVRARLHEFQGKERDAQAAFRLFLAAEQASMQYDGDFSAGRIAREREKIGKCSMTMRGSR